MVAKPRQPDENFPDQVRLTDKEGELFRKAILSPPELSEPYEIRIQKLRWQKELAQLLIERNAIPEHRLKSFEDDDYSPGRKSPLRQFQDNGNSNDEILEHPHFGRYLKYFINGPDLPPSMMDEFSRKVDDFGQFSSSDVTTLSTFCRALVRKYRLSKTQTDQIFWLVLEKGIWVEWARMVRKSARSTAKT